MEEETVRRQAEAHAQATVAGDLKVAGSDLTQDALPAAGAVMKQMPKPLTGSAIDSVTAEGNEYVVLIRYSGEDSATVVESRWAEHEGRPRIVDLKVI
ncbi:MAG: hypothetical protein ACRDJS_01850 [Actinomycetota bacterium]